MHIVNGRLVRLDVRVGELGDLAAFKILHRDIRIAVAPVSLAPVAGKGAVERDLGGVLLHHTRPPEVHRHGPWRRSIECDTVKRRPERTRAARTREYDLASIWRPVQRLIVARMPCELFGFSTSGGHDVHVVVAEPIAGERDPASVGREARHDIARHMGRQAARICPVGVGQPDVVLVREGDRAVVGHVGISRELDRLLGLGP